MRALESDGIKVSLTSLLNYISYFEETLILFCVKRYDVKGKKLLSIQEKYYAIDPGLRNVVKSSEKIDTSKLYENTIYLEMLSKIPCNRLLHIRY